jgi:hypothetical protein
MINNLNFFKKNRFTRFYNKNLSELLQNYNQTTSKEKNDKSMYQDSNIDSNIDSIVVYLIKLNI